MTKTVHRRVALHWAAKNQTSGAGGSKTNTEVIRVGVEQKWRRVRARNKTDRRPAPGAVGAHAVKTSEGLSDGAVVSTFHLFSVRHTQRAHILSHLLLAREPTMAYLMARPPSPSGVVPVPEEHGGWRLRTVQQTALSFRRVYCHPVHAPLGE